jgi:hypothetical protein
MIRHVLLLQPRPETTPEVIAQCRDALGALVGAVPGLTGFSFGENFAAAERREGFTHGFTMDFVDREALAAYGPHPAHRPVAAMVRAAFERIVVLDIDL